MGTYDGNILGSPAVLGAANAFAIVELRSHQGCGLSVAAGTLAGTLTPEISIDGVTWVASRFIDVTGTLTSTLVVTNPNAASNLSIVVQGGAQFARVRVSSYTSGTANAFLVATDVTSQSGASGGGGGGSVTQGTSPWVVSGTVTANVGTTNGLALDSTVAAINTKTPALGQTTMAGSQPVAIASDQSAVPVSVASLPLPTGAATQTTLAAINTKLPGLGQAVMAASQPVVLASDQSAVLITGSVNVGARENLSDGAFIVTAVPREIANVFFNSTDFTQATWTKTRATASFTGAGPGATLSTLLTETATTGAHLVRQTIQSIIPNSAGFTPTTLEGTWTLSASAAVSSGTSAFIALTFDGVHFSWFNIGGSALGTVDSSHIARMVALPDAGWFRCSITSKGPISPGAPSINMAASNGATSYAGNTGNTMNIYNAQLEPYDGAGLDVVTGTSSGFFGSKPWTQGPAGSTAPLSVNQIGGRDTNGNLQALAVGNGTAATGAAPLSVTQSGNITPTLSNVAGSASSVTLLASNTSRKGAAIVNDSTAILYVKFGTTASTSSYSVQMAGSSGGLFSYYEVPFNYTGIITGIWASATGNARVTEVTP